MHGRAEGATHALGDGVCFRVAARRPRREDETAVVETCHFVAIAAASAQTLREHDVDLVGRRGHGDVDHEQRGAGRLAGLGECGIEMVEEPARFARPVSPSWRSR